jgi:hypothetical protein
VTRDQVSAEALKCPSSDNLRLLAARLNGGSGASVD